MMSNDDGIRTEHDGIVVVEEDFVQQSGPPSALMDKIVEYVRAELAPLAATRYATVSLPDRYEIVRIAPEVPLCNAPEHYWYDQPDDDEDRSVSRCVHCGVTKRTWVAQVEGSGWVDFREFLCYEDDPDPTFDD